MKFLYEKQTKRFYLFLTVICMLQVCIWGGLGVLQVQNIRKIFTEHELAATSYLLEQEVSPALIASAWNHTEVTKESRELLEMIGHTEHTQSYFLLLLEQTSIPSFAALLSAGMLFTAVLLTGTGLYLRKREQMYEEAESVILQYTENQFQAHLPAGKTGTIYHLFESVEQLALSLQAKGEMEHNAKRFLKDMISNISHQLKTPLAALHMYMEIIRDEPRNEETVKNFSQKSIQSLARMEQLIQSLLKMARLDTGNIVFEKQLCFVSDITAQAINDLLERAKQEKKELRIEGAPEAKLLCDPAWTKEAIGNLVKNALDHTEAGDVVRISWKDSPAVFRLEVEDSGCGIDPEDIHHIFKQFYRSRTSSDRQGAGLGLSLAKSIMEGQGGNLSVESCPGEGSRFRMTFLTNL